MDENYGLTSQAAIDYVRFAQQFAAQQNAELLRQQQALQERDLAIEEQKLLKIAAIDEQLNKLSPYAKNGRGVQYEINRQKKLIEYQSELAKINPEDKSAEIKAAILTKKYNPEQLAKPFEDTDEYKAALARKVKIEDDFKVVNVLRDQLAVVGRDLARSKLLEAQGGEENTKEAAFIKDRASQYALQNITQTLQGAVTANAEQLNEVLRKADSLMSPFKQYQQGAKFGAVTAGVINRIMNSKPGSPERESSVSAFVENVKQAINSDPEAWYKNTKKAIDSYTQTQNDANKIVVDTVGDYHAAKMGIRKMGFKDPLAEVESMMPAAAIPQMYGGVQSVSTGEMGANAVSSGSAGMTPSRQAMPTSSSPIKFRYVTSP